MTAMDLGDVMSLIGDALSDVPGLRVYPFPPDSAQPPFAFVAMPESIEYDLTMKRGFDRFTLKVYVGVAMVVDRAAQAALCDYSGTSTAGSIKTAVEAHLSIGHSGVRVTRADFGDIIVAGQQYAGVVFTIDVAA